MASWRARACFDGGCHCRLAAEVERLQPFAEKVAELEARVESYQQELAGVREEHESEEVSPDGLQTHCVVLFNVYSILVSLPNPFPPKQPSGILTSLHLWEASSSGRSSRD